MSGEIDTTKEAASKARARKRKAAFAFLQRRLPLEERIRWLGEYIEEVKSREVRSIFDEVLEILEERQGQ